MSDNLLEVYLLLSLQDFGRLAQVSRLYARVAQIYTRSNSFWCNKVIRLYPIPLEPVTNANYLDLYLDIHTPEKMLESGNSYYLDNINYSYASRDIITAYVRGGGRTPVAMVVSAITLLTDDIRFDSLLYDRAVSVKWDLDIFRAFPGHLSNAHTVFKNRAYPVTAGCVPLVLYIEANDHSEAYQCLSYIPGKIRSELLQRMLLSDSEINEQVFEYMSQKVSGILKWIGTVNPAVLITATEAAINDSYHRERQRYTRSRLTKFLAAQPTEPRLYICLMYVLAFTSYDQWSREMTHTEYVDSLFELAAEAGVKLTPVHIENLRIFYMKYGHEYTRSGIYKKLTALSPIANREIIAALHLDWFLDNKQGIEYLLSLRNPPTAITLKDLDGSRWDDSGAREDNLLVLVKDPRFKATSDTYPVLIYAVKKGFTDVVTSYLAKPGAKKDVTYALLELAVESGELPTIEKIFPYVKETITKPQAMELLDKASRKPNRLITSWLGSRAKISVHLTPAQRKALKIGASK